MSAWRAAFLASDVPVPGGHYKRLGDCTASDLAYATAMRRKLAAENTQWANKFEALHRLLELSGGTVKDLSDAAIRAAVGEGVAA